MLDGTHYFECACGSAEHTIRFTLDIEDKEDPPMIFGDIYLDHYMPWWKRIWVAFKYVFRLPPQNSHFDSWIMYEPDAKRLRNMLDGFLK